MCVVGKRALAPGDSIKLEITHKGKRVAIDGTIVWHSMEGKEDHFHGVSLASKDLFYLLIKE